MSRQAATHAAYKRMPHLADNAADAMARCCQLVPTHTIEAFGVLGLVPASVELRADASVPTRLLSRLLACLLFARSRALQQVYTIGVWKIQASLSKTSTTCILS